MPSGILHISTYPFVPPTAMSGWLRRLFMLSNGRYPNTTVKKPNYFVMPSNYYIMGAYPAPDPQTSYQIHVTRRQGIRSFTHNAFSRLVRYADKKEVYQLHTWEYLLVDEFRGFVLHEQQEMLEQLQKLVNQGSKLGKEGFAYLDHVSEVVKLERKQAQKSPDTLVGGPDLVTRPGNLFVMYRHQYKPERSLLGDLHQPTPSPVTGFVPVWVGWPAEREVELTYWTNDEWHIPVSLVETLYG
jgi:hypothetical protein